MGLRYRLAFWQWKNLSIIYHFKFFLLYHSALVLDSWYDFFYYMEVSTFIVVTSAAILLYRIFLASFSFPPLLISANACNFFKVLQLFNIVECGQCISKCFKMRIMISIFLGFWFFPRKRWFFEFSRLLKSMCFEYVYFLQYSFIT